MRLLLVPVVFLTDLRAILSILGSRALGRVKLLWIVGIVVIPVIGFLAWLLVGPKNRDSGRAGTE